MATKNKQKRKHKQKNKPKPSTPKWTYTAATADRHILYGLSVQNVEAEIDFVDERFEIIRGRKAALLREDFCGTANTAAEWVQRRDSNHAVGLDIDEETLEWGARHNVGPLSEEQQERVRLFRKDVMDPPEAARNVDVVLAMNFSYWLFQTRELMRQYFERVRDSLAPDGVFFLDHYGGSEAMTECQDDKFVGEHDNDPDQFTYVWDQNSYNPITGEMQCYIHFEFPDETRMDKAFDYKWRLWTLPEIQELLKEAGFKNVTVYWEGTDEDDEEEGNGVFEPTTVGDADPAYITYITAEK
ncbi:MAG: class I SAM-dependent methyltransferase [Planctomycetota bacterium]